MSEGQENTGFSANFQALSLFRIAFCLVLAVDFFANDLPFYADLYGDSGIYPISALVKDVDRPGLAAMLPLIAAFDVLKVPALLPVLYPIALAAFALGYRTRWANAAAFVLHGYLFWRNPYLRSGADALGQLLLLWCLFLPMDRYWSVDAALNPAARDRPYPSLPFVAIRLQISSVYLFAALFKLAGDPWRSGAAVLWSLSDNVFGATPIGLWLVREAPALLIVVNYATIAFQLAFPFMIYSPFDNDRVRAIALAIAAAMHVSFIVCLNIGAFPYVSLVALLLLVPDRWIDRLFARRRERLAQVAIYYEPDCGFCQRTSLLLREFLLSSTANVQPASVEPDIARLLVERQSWVVRGDDGKLYLKWAAMAYVLRQHPFTAWLGWLFDIPRLKPAMDHFYDLIGRNRRRLGPVARVLFPLRSKPPVGRATIALCAALAILALGSNVSSVVRMYRAIPQSFEHLVALAQVRQEWKLFAPNPVHHAWTYRVIGRGPDGSGVDLSHVLPVTIVPGALQFSSHRWLKYHVRFDELSKEEWSALGRYLCRRARAASALAVRTIEVEMSTRPVVAIADPADVKVRQGTFDCEATP